MKAYKKFFILIKYCNNTKIRIIKKKAQFIEIQKFTLLLVGQSQVIHLYEQLF